MNDYKAGDDIYVFKKDAYGWPWYLTPNPPYTEKGKVVKEEKYVVTVALPLDKNHAKIVEIIKDEAGKTELEVLEKELAWIDVVDAELTEKILEVSGKPTNDYTETLYEEHKRFTTWRVGIQKEIRKLQEKEENKDEKGKENR
jgi:hypothetical protein